MVKAPGKLKERRTLFPRSGEGSPDLPWIVFRGSGTCAQRPHMSQTLRLPKAPSSGADGLPLRRVQE